MNRFLGWHPQRKLVPFLNTRAKPELDVYQFGVYTGVGLCEIARRLGGYGRLWGVDSFVGLPAEASGLWVPPHWQPGAFSAADALGLHDEQVLFGTIKDRCLNRSRGGNWSASEGWR